MLPRVHSCLALLLSLLLPPAILEGRSAEATVPSGADRLKVDLLGVFAHPDDETGVAATVAMLAHGSGRTVAHVYCTRGEGGGNMVGTQSGPALGILREIELRDALQGLGVRQVHFLDKADFAYTESLAITLERWNHEDTLGRLVRVVRTLRPEVLVTMNPAPSPGQHGNHQAAGWLATEAFEAAADPARFPDQLRLEGLSPWRPRRLFYSGVAGDAARALSIPVARPLPDGRLPVTVAAEALSNHRSQAFGSIAQSPWFRRTTNQWFTPVMEVLPTDPAQADLFQGLPVPGACPRDAKNPGHPLRAMHRPWTSCRGPRWPGIGSSSAPTASGTRPNHSRPTCRWWPARKPACPSCTTAPAVRDRSNGGFPRTGRPG